MLRRLHKDQPASFAFTPANLAWAEGQISKYPEGRQASAIIPLLWRAQEQEGWLSRPAIEHVADMLGLAYIRALEVATFYFMFQLQPVGSIAHVQICGNLKYDVPAPPFSQVMLAQMTAAARQGAPKAVTGD